MSAFSTPAPEFDDSEITKIALRHYGLRVSGVTSLVSERDQNARLSTEKGEFVLKIANAGEDVSSLDYQNAMLMHFECHAPELAVPRLIKTCDGAQMADHDGPTGTHKVRLLTYLQGKPLAKVTRFPDLMENLGAFMGRVSHALRSFTHPAAERPDFIWALDNAILCAPFASDIVDPDKRAKAIAAFKKYKEVIAPKLALLRKATVHQDANDYNLLVGESDTSTVAGLIDFGDACYGAQVNELAVTLAYALMDVEDVAGAASAVIRGYTAAFPLEQNEIEVLLDLLIMRLWVSVSISSNRSKDNPDNEYLLISQKPAFDLLDKIELLNADGYLQRLFTDAAFAGRCDSQAQPARIAREDLLDRRKQSLNPALSVSYRKPLHIVKGRGAYLYDETGAQYLDCVNNISHIGHCHPHIIAEAAYQSAQLNTNSRYLHHSILDFADRIAATLPGELSVVTFVNSGTEANELALRMARTATGRKGTIVLDWAYHGNATATIEISPYKFQRAGGFAKPDFVEIAEFPDPYRGRYKGMGENAGIAYAQSVGECVERLSKGKSGGPACFIAESISGVGGQVLFPNGYLKAAYEHVRKAGGLCIADEVQCGFGRVGEHFWGFERQGVTPDIVVLGKPIGGGHPLAAVVTTPEIARKFANGMEYFNSFGGNPVSMAIGMAVMDVIEGEGLAARASATGGFLLNELRTLQERYEVIGDVRGAGLFSGVELVEDRETQAPATKLAGDVVNDLRDNHGILLSTDGPLDNVLKIKPPMVFGEREAKLLTKALDEVLGALT